MQFFSLTLLSLSYDEGGGLPIRPRIIAAKIFKISLDVTKAFVL